MITLRPYQQDIASKACNLLQVHRIAYLSMMVRTGKTLTSLYAADLFGATNVLFITKKKAIGSIESDYAALCPSYTITVTNYERIHYIERGLHDLVICDEAHCLSQFPIPAERTKQLKILVAGLPIIFLSGTPTPESYSQIYHQFFISSYSPFAEYKNFYSWAKRFVCVKEKYVFNRKINDYSSAYHTLIEEKINHLFLSYSQVEAGFKQDVIEEVLKVQMAPTTYGLANKIKSKRVHIGSNGEEIIADTEVKLMQKLHQIYSGTVLSESAQAICFDSNKVLFIKEKFKGQKIAIFYKFKGEFTLLQKVFGSQLTSSPEDFNSSTDKIFCSQIQSGREGINLSTADALVMYNIDYSSVSYQQSRARMQTKDRVKPCLLYWIFSEGGIEEKIYERVMNKQDFTMSYFRKVYNIKPSIKSKENGSLERVA